MTVTLQDPGRIGPYTYKVVWSSNLSDPLYRVYRDGQLSRVGRRNFEIITVRPGAGLLLEVRDDGLPAASAGEGQVTLHWAAVSGAAAYRIEEQVNGDWRTRAVVRDQGGPRLTWRSAPLSDAHGHSLRVTPIGTNGNAGTPATVTARAVRHPAPPAVDFAYSDETNKVTITAA